MTEKVYRELFCLITFTDQEHFFIVPYLEIDDPTMAEVAIPFEAHDAIYGITCYITNLANSFPAIAEMVILQSAAELLYRACTQDPREEPEEDPDLFTDFD